MKHFFVVAFSFLAVTIVAAQKPSLSVASPSGKIKVTAFVNGQGQPKYAVYLGNEMVLQPSSLGLVQPDADFSEGLSVGGTTPLQKVQDRYQLLTGKKMEADYTANKQVLRLRNRAGQQMNIEFQVSDDGVAFRYHLPAKGGAMQTVQAEKTSFLFPAQTKAWLQPMSVAKTGWESTNPSYEEHYRQGIAAGTPAPNKAGWVYPALFQTGNNWVLISEAGLDTAYCGTRLDSASTGGEYRVAFPDPREVIGDGNLLPRSSGALYSPWRVLVVGSLATIVHSTLGTDVAAPAIKMQTAFVKPGKASWSWINSKDDFIVYDEQKKYIDFAAEMGWQYCLIDVNWDQKIGYDKIAELAKYGAQKGVGLILWYNSAGPWNTVKYTPKDKLLTHESRMQEFNRIKAMGISGVKIDFFGGDGQSNIKYYHEILKDAAAVGLMVNFHGATLPRGWQRTYPNLVTVEAVKGFEFITFSQYDADQEATHSTMLPFTRNAFDPMDFTPMNLNRIYTNVKRRTTPAFELATTVMFLSGVQHFAESPEGMAKMPTFVKDYLRQLPANWDETRYIDGFPGKFAVLARRKGNRWYLAGLSSETADRELRLPLAQFGKKRGTLISDSGNDQFLAETVLPTVAAEHTITLKPSGGFVLVLE
ncbi:glycoside hydrolase family 97 protein [Pseudocnuella soli]|uniref:glycoside hydrolase family 97 protein n=1 Tax=Pseudocnuella soli TaxID=2502779 RepID=UPI0010429799|nr:glycoside hydrolase family 97 protein [Pseudocnuella soli]